MVRRKIVHILPFLDFGGVQTHRLTIAKYIDRDRDDIRMCCLSGYGAIAKEIEEIGIPVRSFEVNPRIPNPRAIYRIYKYLRREKPDIVHTAVIEANFHGVLASYLAQVAVIIAEEVGVPADRGKRGRFMNRLIVHLSDRIVTKANAVRDYLIEQENIPSTKISVIYNPVDKSLFERYLGDEEPPNFIDRDDAIVIGTVGRLSSEKGHIYLLKAFQLVLKEMENLELIVVGDGTLKEYLVRFSQDGEFYDKVIFTGLRRDVPKLLNAMDIFVLPSLTEGLPNALLEAMCSGLPVVASKVGGVPEVVDDGINGFLVEPKDTEALADAILRVISMDEDTRREMGRKGREKVIAKFSPEMYIEKLTSLYESLLI